MVHLLAIQSGWWTLLGAVGLVAVGVIALAILNPRLFVRSCFRPMLALLYSKRLVGEENFPKTGGAVVICNHASWLDGILLLWMLPRNARFIVDGGNFDGKFAQYLAGAFDTILMAANVKSIGRALKAGRQGLHDGHVIAIFPEGTITRSGQLQAFRPGVTKILKGTDVPIVPMFLDGMWGSLFSFSEGKFFWKWPAWPRRQLTLYIGTPLPVDAPLDRMRNAVQQLGSKAMIEQRQRMPKLPCQIVRAWKKRGGKMQNADSSGVELSGRMMLLRTLVLQRILRREVLLDPKQEPTVGILLPPSVAGVAVNVAMAFERRTAANLNYTVSSDVLNRCIESAGIKHVLTSVRFMEKMNFDLDADVVLLEDFKDKATLGDKIWGVIGAYLLPAFCLERLLGLRKIACDDLLAVIFTSGSTGTPKGVMLSHANISHNVEAIKQSVRLDSDDVVLGILPFFHSFGYAVTLWAVQTLGPQGVYHFNPLDARQVGKLAEKYQATVLLGTPTFLRGYLRRIEPGQFASLDVVVVGAEKMPADLFESFEKRFGVRPVEGYGTTELSPLVSVNIPPSRSAAKFQPDRFEGSVGRPFPGISAKVVSPEDGSERGAGEDGLLLITGPNVMQGYMGREDLTSEVLQDGWYITGDIANVDKEGFLHITGRQSRFSKIGGEMVPHIRVEEELAKQLLVDDDDDGEDDVLRVCVTAIPDAKKGERLIVLQLPSEKDPSDLRKGLTEAGLPNLFLPAADAFYTVEEIPVLGTGKLDLKGARVLAEQLTDPAAANETQASG
ncbi:Bifunctional protein Aas [Roseimaritima multifibrata]|uniref:Bifunctional protein Aas n=1 Tax=Roseimaritima multifibrata TaxID=1930274 RepID=A0A517MCQ3_9BACT|nr:AMP-binding protein [Roseimaritima multifibrata]QDS92606.1 Bifunctional protein Aas [Roseimaritima multifibrata]